MNNYLSYLTPPLSQDLLCRNIQSNHQLGLITGSIIQGVQSTGTLMTTDRVNSEPLQSFHIEFRLSKEILLPSTESYRYIL